MTSEVVRGRKKSDTEGEKGNGGIRDFRGVKTRRGRRQEW